MGSRVVARLEFDRLPEIIAALPQAANEAVLDTARDIRADMQESIVDGGSPHVPSQPGEPPHSETGELRGSIAAELTGEGQAAVNVGAEHGLYLEFGTVKMAPRPFATPAAEKNRDSFRDKCMRLLARVIR